ncbi:MAG TPA: hypothetical protein P5274_01935 [Candidatus Paceibacterota bacterium]|nr:hypothetical protein [Candidatus Paceibacterota bacterium]
MKKVGNYLVAVAIAVAIAMLMFTEFSQFYSRLLIAVQAEESLTETVEVWDCGPSTSNHSISYHEENGKIWGDGTLHDYCVLVNPRVEGEKVFIPVERLSDSEKGKSVEHWFYRDQCSLITEPVYALRPGGGENGKYEVYSYDPNGRSREKRAEEPRTYDDRIFLIAPKIEGHKVILDPTWGTPDPKRVYWMNRSDFIWVNPPADLSK